MTRLIKAEAIERLRRMKRKIPGSPNNLREAVGYWVWARSLIKEVDEIFGPESVYKKDIAQPVFLHWILNELKPQETAHSLVQSMIDDISNNWKEDAKIPVLIHSQPDKKPITNKIFVIHGRDLSVRKTIVRLLKGLKLEPIILDQQPNEGRTIIEKFEDHANVGFAVALLTPDDVGALRDGPSKLSPRARQNVILELGFFLGALGRKRVCALVKGDVEMPSDYDGVVYIPLDDADEWKIKLVEELKAAGFNIDANRAFGP